MDKPGTEMQKVDVGSVEKLVAELEMKKFQLSSLLEITQAINQNFSREQLFSIYKFVLKTQLNIRKIILFVYDGDWKIPIQSGTDIDPQSMNIVRELFGIKEISEAHENMSPIFRQFHTIIPVLHKNRPLAYVLIGDFPDIENKLKSDLIPFIQTLTNIIIVAIENKNFAREQIRQEGMKKELELAAQMQSMLFPSTLPKDDDIEMYATYLPHQEVGGDYYDCIPVNENELIFCMADVSGKGIPAALLMSNFQANLHALVKVNEELTELVRQLNHKVLESAQSEKFITFFLGKYNKKTKLLSYINAGHNPPILLQNGTVISLSQGTTGLGILDDLPRINVGMIEMKKDSMLLCYTDGVIDTENDKEENYGYDRLSGFFTKNASKIPPSLINQALIENLVNFKGRKKFPDDVTLLSCKFF